MYLDIYYTTNFIRKVQHKKPLKKKYLVLKKLDKDCSYDSFSMNMGKLAKDNSIEVKGKNEQESLF